MDRVIVNTRTLGSSSLTGVQRYTLEILKRLDKIETIAPKQPQDGLKGHLWEQTILPNRLGNKLLWSPANTGPLAVRRQVLTIHDLSPLDHPENFSRGFSAWYKFLLPRLMRRVSRVLTVSEYSRKRVIELAHIEPERVFAVHNGVEARFQPRSKPEVEQVKKNLGLPSPHYVLSLSSLEPRKNLHRLLQAWAQVYPELPEEVWLVIAGGKGRSLVFREVSFDPLPPRVYLTGRVQDQDLPALYTGALAFIYPSVYEGFGLPPLEAMATGTPIITGNLTSLPEVVADAGLMVDPYNVEAIAEALKRLIDEEALRMELGKKGLERAALFTWERTADLTGQVFQAAIRDQ
jgi:glycosyltransferase involved in cell wall biosynthesis